MTLGKISHHEQLDFIMLAHNDFFNVINEAAGRGRHRRIVRLALRRNRMFWNLNNWRNGHHWRRQHIAGSAVRAGDLSAQGAGRHEGLGAGDTGVFGHKQDVNDSNWPRGNSTTCVATGKTDT